MSFRRHNVSEDKLKIEAAIETLKKEGLRRHTILRFRLSELMRAEAHAERGPYGTPEIRKLYSMAGRMSHAIRNLNLFEGPILPRD